METFQQWRGIQGKYPLELHKFQHNIQRTPDQIRDPGQPLPTCTPTSVLEQLRKRIKVITDDMTSIARSCCTEVAAGGALPPSPERRGVQLRPPKRRRKPAHRSRKMDEKRACSDTTEESVSSTPPQRKRVRAYKGFPSNLVSHVALPDSCRFHIVCNNNTTFPSATSRQPDSSSHCTLPHARVSTNLCVTHSLWLKCSLAWSSNQRHGGYAGIRVGEAVNPGPATKERDWTDEQPNPTHRRINEAGDSVLSSQDAVTRAVQNLRISDSPASMASPAPPVPAVGNRWRQPRPKQQPREYLRCAQCGSDPAAHVASSDHGLTLHTGQKHGGQRLMSESIGSCVTLTVGPV